MSANSDKIQAKSNTLIVSDFDGTITTLEGSIAYTKLDKIRNKNHTQWENIKKILDRELGTDLSKQVLDSQLKDLRLSTINQALKSNVIDQDTKDKLFEKLVRWEIVDKLKELSKQNAIIIVSYSDKETLDASIEAIGLTKYLLHTYPAGNKARLEQLQDAILYYKESNTQKFDEEQFKLIFLDDSARNHNSIEKNSHNIKVGLIQTIQPESNIGSKAENLRVIKLIDQALVKPIPKKEKEQEPIFIIPNRSSSSSFTFDNDRQSLSCTDANNENKSNEENLLMDFFSSETFSSSSSSESDNSICSSDNDNDSDSDSDNEINASSLTTRFSSMQI